MKFLVDELPDYMEDCPYIDFRAGLEPEWNDDGGAWENVYCKKTGNLCPYFTQPYELRRVEDCAGFVAVGPALAEVLQDMDPELLEFLT